MVEKKRGEDVRMTSAMLHRVQLLRNSTYTYDDLKLLNADNKKQDDDKAKPKTRGLVPNPRLYRPPQRCVPCPLLTDVLPPLTSPLVPQLTTETGSYAG